MGKPIPVRDWWLAMVRERMKHDGREYRELGEALAKRVGRSTPFDKATLSRVATGKGPITDDVIAALCLEFRGLPWPVFIPNTLNESIVMTEAMREYWRRGVDEEEIDEKNEPAVVSFPRRIVKQEQQEVVRGLSRTAKRKAS